MVNILLQLWRWLLSLLRRGRHEREMEEEMRFHLEMQIEQNLSSGMAAEEAHYAARRQFGNQTWLKEVSREMWGLTSVETLIQDLRYGARRLMRNPGFALIAVITLSLGIGATVAIFSVVNGVLLKPLSYPHPEELLDVTLTSQGLGISDMGVSPSAYFIFREHSGAFQDIGLYSRGINGAGDSVNITGLGEPERAPALGVTDGLLPILGVTPLLGRSFTRADDSPNSADTVILTYGYWSRKFGGDRSVIGRTIEVDGKPRAIIGVAPESFRFLDQTRLAMLLPLRLNREKTFLGVFVYGGIARLKPGVTLQQANADVARMLPIEVRSFSMQPGFSLKMFEDLRLGPNLRPLKQDVVGDVGKVLWVLMGGISLVLLIACANLANLLLVRAEGRRQELAIRAALGASRGRIAAQLFIESLILAVFGGLFGIGMAYWALRVLIAMAPQSLPRIHEIGVDGNVALFTGAVSLAASLLFGSVPVFKYPGAGLGLSAGGRSMSESRDRQRSRGVLVIVQVALALVLLVGSGLMIRTFRALTRVNPGFVAPSEVQTFRIAIRDDQAPDAEPAVRIEEEILRKIEAIPGVTSVGLSTNVPMDGSGRVGPVFAKDSAFAHGAVPSNRFEFVAPGFFKTLGAPLLAGRDYTWGDIYNKVPIAIVSEKFARESWRDPLSAIGKQIRASQKDDWREVVGVVGDVRQDGADKEAPTSVYWPILVASFQGNSDVQAQRNVTFAIRCSRAGSEGLVNEIRQAVWSVAPNLPLAEVHTLNYYYAMSMARISFTLVMLAVAGGMALFLGIVGLYGVIAYSVSQRRREIGIRMALGAEKSAILNMIIGQGIKLVLIGVAIGLAAALGLTRFLSGLLYGVKPGDPATLVAVSALLMAIALLASYIPARQAAKVDPMVALRHD
ncbi:MAG TPA: ABC transporter permease [Blastocatellia bacterium]|nr:ABC transporter permease [Blastocatellia bacterium]